MNAYREHVDQDGLAGLPSIGNSSSMEQVYALVAHVAAGHGAVLLRGERGTGTEDLARSIHRMSNRASQPFVRVTWAEITEAFVESDLFGRVIEPSGSRLRRGKFEKAEGGTLFIEEVGDFSTAMQGKLMRCIRERAYVRPGGDTLTPADVRIVAATAQNLHRLIEEGRFLKDFYHELSTFTIRIPPLRERKGDILLLAQHFIRKHAASADKPVQRLSSKAASLLLEYAWPGNVSELEHCIEHAVLLCTNGTIDTPQLPPGMIRMETNAPECEDSLPATLESIERTLIVDALRASNGNRSKAAQLLGITERLMGLRVRKYELEPRTYRGGDA